MSRVESKVEVRQLPKFDGVIQIEVSVDAIYQKLLGEFPEEYKHREMVSHAIIGSAQEKDTLHYIYNALNGFTQDINFQVGDIVECTEKYRYERYDAKQETEVGEIIIDAPNKTAVDYVPNWKTRRIAIGKCKVLKINLYAKDKLKVEFMGYDSYSPKDAASKKTSWVDHKNCTVIPTSVMMH